MQFVDFLAKYQKEAVEKYPFEKTAPPLVTVSVTTYNHQHFIKDCLDSILMQKTNFDFEILLGEDSSNDGTRAICIEYAQKYPTKIRLFLHKRANNIKINNAPTGRFNFLYNLHAAQGKYTALCDGDDYWTDPLKLQKQVDFLEKNKEFSICGHDIKTIDEHNQIIKNTLSANQGTYTDRELAKGNFIPTVSTLFRNEFRTEGIPEYLSEIPTGDWGIHLLNAQRGKIHFIAEAMAAYRVHSGGIWLGKSFEKRKKLFELTIQILKKAYGAKYQKEFNEAERYMELCHISSELGAGHFAWSMLGDIPAFFQYQKRFQYNWKDILWLYKNGLFSSKK